MRHNPKTFGVFATMALLAFFAMACAARAETVIISDTFTADDETVLDERTPETSLPGTAYEANGQGWGASAIYSNSAALNTDAANAVNISSTGGYTKPTQLTISGSLHLGGITGDLGVGLGFWSAMGQANEWVGVTGVYLAYDGTVKFVDLREGTDIREGLAYSGTWDAEAWHTMSYDVDTTTGVLSNLKVDGTSYAFTTTDAPFTDAQTTYAGFGVTAGAGDEIGYVDNFTLSTSTGTGVPEPSTLVLLSIGLVGLVAYAWRKRK